MEQTKGLTRRKRKSSWAKQGWKLERLYSCGKILGHEVPASKKDKAPKAMGQLSG